MFLSIGHRIHGTGIFTYILVELYYMVNIDMVKYVGTVNIPVPRILSVIIYTFILRVYIHL